MRLIRRFQMEPDDGRLVTTRDKDRDKDRGERLHDHGERAADGLLGEEGSTGGGLIQDDYDMGASPEAEPEVREEPRVSIVSICLS
jgi:hypothetical protein